jgi:hypothetical protein
MVVHEVLLQSRSQAVKGVAAAAARLLPLLIVCYLPCWHLLLICQLGLLLAFLCYPLVYGFVKLFWWFYIC